MNVEVVVLVDHLTHTHTVDFCLRIHVVRAVIGSVAELACPPPRVGWCGCHHVDLSLFSPSPSLPAAVITTTTTMTDRKAVIKNADMSEDMQQDAVDCATQAMEKYNIEKDIAAYIKKVREKDACLHRISIAYVYI